MQQQEYEKSLIQEKSLYKRNNVSLDRIIEVALISFENKDLITSKSAFIFILENTIDPENIFAIDENLLNNSMKAESDGRAGIRLSSGLLFLVESLFSSLWGW